jgi:hypothetical protein
MVRALASEGDFLWEGTDGGVCAITFRLEISPATGAPDSFFSVTGQGLPPDSQARISVNRVTLGTIATSSNGTFTFTLSTSGADIGAYYVMASVNPQATAGFVLSSDYPMRPKEGDFQVFSVPSRISYTADTAEVFLPMIR